MNPLKAVNKGYRIISHRLRTQGVRTTVIWAHGRGMPKLTGVPPLQYSRVTPNIYVGPQYGRNGKKVLEAAGFEYSVNMRIEFDDAAYGLALKNYCYLPTIDDDAPSMEHLQMGVTFIQQAVEANGKVYIHCAGGIGRAPTMVAAYFITQGMALDEAVAHIMRVRPFIVIMPPQLEQLKRFEADYRHKVTIKS